jgi:hypothetical protein
MNPESHSPSSLVLSSRDLVEKILEQFVGSSEDAQASAPPLTPVLDRRSLFMASLTSKYFAEPAINILWRTMDSLCPLVRLLPGLKRHPDNGRFVCFHFHSKYESRI